jgi:hypothetical protein
MARSRRTKRLKKERGSALHLDARRLRMTEAGRSLPRLQCRSIKPSRLVMILSTMHVGK